MSDPEYEKIVAEQAAAGVPKNKRRKTKKEYIPTPEEIEAACLAIQQEWDADQEFARRVQKRLDICMTSSLWLELPPEVDQ